MTVHLIHGFREKHKLGKPKMRVLVEPLERRGHKVRVHDYGKWDLLATRNNENLARFLWGCIEDGDVLIGYSNGADVIARVLKLTRKVTRVILIQPALKKNWNPPRHVEQVIVIWNPGDLATVAGKQWRRLANIMPWNWSKKDEHTWGEMAHTGYTGKSKKFIQYNSMDTKNLPKAKRHSAWMKKPEWWELIADHA